MLPEHHIRLSLQIAEHGIDAHHDDVVRYVSALRRNGQDGVLLDVAADPSHPAVARERAFGRLLARFTHAAASDAVHSKAA